MTSLFDEFVFPQSERIHHVRCRHNSAHWSFLVFAGKWKMIEPIYLKFTLNGSHILKVLFEIV